MKKRVLSLLGISLILSMFLAFSSLAGQWQQDIKGWLYQNDDGSYIVNQWKEIDGKQYYFGSDGYMFSDTTTPDGSMVGADGAKLQDSTISITINPMIFKEMNSTVGQLADKYGGIPYPEKFVQFDDEKSKGSLILFGNEQKAFHYYYGEEYFVEKPDYLPEWDKNGDGVCDKSDWEGMSLDEINASTAALTDSWVIDINKKPKQIEGYNMLSGTDTVGNTVEAIAEQLKLLGATNIDVENHTYKQEKVAGRSSGSYGIIFEGTGEYEEKNDTSLSFVLNGLKFSANGSWGKIYDSAYWTVRQAN